MVDLQISHYFQLQQFSPFVPYGWNRNQVNMVLSVIAISQAPVEKTAAASSYLHTVCLSNVVWWLENVFIKYFITGQKLNPPFKSGILFLLYTQKQVAQHTKKQFLSPQLLGQQVKKTSAMQIRVYSRQVKGRLSSA